MTRRVRGAQGRLGGHAPKSRTRSIMVSSIGGGVVGDVVDGNVASKAGDVSDNGGMTCGGEVFGVGGVEYMGGMKLWEGGVEYSCGMEVSGVVWNTLVVWKSHQWNDQQHDHPINDHLAHQLDHDLAHHFSLSLDLESVVS